MLSILRLVFALLFFFISLLAVVKAPTNSLWKLSIVVMEWGQWFALIVAIPLFTRWWTDRIGITSAVFSLAAVILALTPIMRATAVAKTIDAALISNFGEKALHVTNGRSGPLVWKDLFSGIPVNNSYKTMEFANPDGVKLTLDYYATAKPNAPCVIVIHGGGWDSGDSQQLPELNGYLAARGYAVLAISYRLAPKYTYEYQIADVLTSIGWVQAHANELGIDSSRIVLLGRSAGAQLALQAAYIKCNANIKGVISYYAPADLVWGYSIPGNPLIMDSRKVLDEYIGGSCFKMEAAYYHASPINHINSECPPALLIHGEPDVLVAYEHTRRMNIKLTAEGVRHMVLNLPWATHGFDYAFNGPGSQLSIYTVERFLAAVTN